MTEVVETKERLTSLIGKDVTIVAGSGKMTSTLKHLDTSLYAVGLFIFNFYEIESVVDNTITLESHDDTY